MKDIRTLKADEIEVKVKQIGEKGCLLLLYKTARTDRQMLDEIFGPMNWTSDYREIKGNLYCGIGCREKLEQPFVWKWDCGVESREDGEGNEKKGEASDSFKRAGFQWGIGVELYTSPFIWASVPTMIDERNSHSTKTSYKLSDRFMSFSVAHINYNDDRKISELLIVDNKGNEVFAFPKKKAVRTEFEKDATQQKKAITKAVQNKVVEAPKPKKSLGERADDCLSFLESLSPEKWIKTANSAKDAVRDLIDACLSSGMAELQSKGQKIGQRLKELSPIIDDSIPY